MNIPMSPFGINPYTSVCRSNPMWLPCITGACPYFRKRYGIEFAGPHTHPTKSAVVRNLCLSIHKTNGRKRAHNNTDTTYGANIM
jgi:hypothetical protein